MLGEFFLDHGKPVSLARRVTRVLLVLSLCSIFFFIGYDELSKANRQNTWIATPCVVIASRVDSLGSGASRDTPYHVAVDVAYRFASVDRTCEISPIAPTDIAADAYAACKAYQPGTRSVCYVDPQTPWQAVLNRQNPQAVKWFIAAVGFITTAVFFFYCIPQLFSYRPNRSIKPNRKISLLSGLGLFAGFGTMSVAWLILPLTDLWRSRHWQAVPAVIVESNVIAEFEGGEISFTTYRSDILFQYQFAGETFYSNCYNVTEGATLIGSLRKRFVARYAPGSPVICYVNTANPAQSTLTRHLSLGIAYGLWPAFLAALGGYAIAFGGDPVRMNRINRGSLLILGLTLAAAIAGLILTQIIAP